MSHPVPPQIAQAVEGLGRALQSVKEQPIDPLTAEWSVIEPGVARLLGGAFDGQNPRHIDVAFAVAMVLGERLRRELGGFWFPDRGAPAGLSLGFEDAIVVVSPFELSVQALARAQLAVFDKVRQDLSEALARGRAKQVMNPGARKLQPDDYQHLFDPGLVQFVALDSAKAGEAWSSTAGQVRRDIEAAFGRLPARVPDKLKQEMRGELVGLLQRLEQEVPLRDQVSKAPALFTLVGLLHGQKQETDFADVELWQGILLPLLHIGAVTDFPPLEDDDLEAFRKGIEPLFIFVETVPYRTPVADEDGLLGVFPDATVAPVDSALQDVPGQRLLKVSPEPLAKVCDAFDAAALRGTLERFIAHLEEKAGGRPLASARKGHEPPMVDVALSFLDALVKLVKTVREDGAALCIRRATAAEVATEEALGELRQTLQAGRIILI